MRASLLLLIFIVSHLSQAQSPKSPQFGLVVTSRPKGFASVFNMPGVDWKTCRDWYDECEPLAWPVEGTRIEIIQKQEIPNVPTKRLPDGRLVRPVAKIYFKIKVPTPIGLKVGFIAAENLKIEKAEPSPVGGVKEKFEEARSRVQHTVQVLDEMNKDPVKRKKLQTNGLKRLGKGGTFGPLCQKFIREDRTLGVWGEEVKRAIAAVDRSTPATESCLLDLMDVKAVCPKFGSFGSDAKIQFWAYVFATLSFDESSCKEDEYNRGAPSCRAVGLFQLEEKASIRKKNGRHPVFCKAGNPFADVWSPKFQIECTVATLNQLHCEDRVRPLVSRGGYWEKLLRPDSRVARYIREFPECY
jgi:hypothetical protein